MAYYSSATAADYENLKTEILVHCSISPTSAVAEFPKWTYHPGVTLQAQMVVRRVVMVWFLQALPLEEQKAIRM